jgi:tRNA pseudouridine38-40 synthase
MNFLINIAFNGAAYCGWQRQLNSVGVQQVLEKALGEVFGCEVLSTAAGRTDAGVHAVSMPVSFSLAKVRVPFNRIVKAVNSRLPYDIRVMELFEKPDDFNARFDAVARSYKYVLTTRRDVFRLSTTGYTFYEIEADRLAKAAQLFLGDHNFTTFSKRNPDTLNPICKISHSRWEIISPTEFHYYVTADRFIYGMVRSLVGAMIDVGRSHRSPQDILNAIKKCDRSLNSPLAPASGLYFMNARYKA